MTITPVPIWVPASLTVDFANPADPGDPTAGPWTITGTAIPSPVVLEKIEDPLNPMVFDGSNHPTSKVNGGFVAWNLGLDFPVSDDSAVNRVPPKLAFEFVGIPGPGVIADMMAWEEGDFRLTGRMDGFELRVGNPTAGESCVLLHEIDFDNVHSYRAEWTNDPEGPGGSAELFVDEVSVASGTFSIKPKIVPSVGFFLNNLLGNFGPSIEGITYHRVTVIAGHTEIEQQYTPFSGDTATGEQAATLGIDAREVTEQQPSRMISYSAPEGPETGLIVVIGEPQLPAGRAYKAVLMTYPDGIEEGPVAHPDELMMTKFTRQNVQFEDEFLYQTQPAWSECLPKGDAPIIDGVVYTCDAIRMGSYVQFQFGYHLDANTNPVEPFGDLNDIEGLSSYMVPHKWYIYDQQGNLLGRVEQPNSDPLNKERDLPMWQGPWGARNAAHTTPSNRWTPCGTIGSAVIWASHDLVDHDRAEIEQRIPIPEQIVPMACHIDFSVNGFDPRVNFGFNSSDGHMNGYANWRVMPYDRSDYESWVAAAPSEDPYTGLEGVNSRGPNGSIWLKYTPFNVQGRSPITGPGGVRDDRQAIAEPVSAYLCSPTATHLANGASFRQIAIDYCRGYASDPFHLFEKGRNVPLYKGRPFRELALAGHYYGPGNVTVPAARRFPLYIGRTSEWIDGYNPIKVKSWLGSDADHPWRGLFGIDDAHAHQFPGWGSLLWKTPEFAFLQIKFFEQVRMYRGSRLFGGDGWSNLSLAQDRTTAWTYLHTALVWKLGSTTSQRLYTRREVLDWAVSELDGFYDTLFETSPGLFNLPVEGQTSPQHTPKFMAWLHALNLFGMCWIDDNNNVFQQSFMRGYWIHALGCAERMGFNDAVRAESSKAGAVLDWMIAKWRQAIVGNLTKITTSLPYNHLWTPAQLESLWPDGEVPNGRMGDISGVPQTYEKLEAVNGVWAAWDRTDEGELLDGQGMSSDLSAPFWLRNVLGQTGEDIDAACAVARARLNVKLAEQEALGAAGGSTWFRYHQGTFTPPLSAPPTVSGSPPAGFSWVVDGTDARIFDDNHRIYASNEG